MNSKTDYEVAEKIGPYIEVEVDTQTNIISYKLPLPKPLHSELQRLANREHVSLRELLTRAARIYLALNITEQKPGTYYTRHVPGEPDERIIFPF